jgi:hypothetical protein
MVLVNTIELLHECLADISPIPVPDHPNYLAVDIEGVNLSRRGRICIVQLQSSLSRVAWLVDVTTLGAQAFDEVDEEGRSLRSILQRPNIQKVCPCPFRVQPTCFRHKVNLAVVLRCEKRFGCLVQFVRHQPQQRI